jgi:hypothetical protein
MPDYVVPRKPTVSSVIDAAQEIDMDLLPDFDPVRLSGNTGDLSGNTTFPFFWHESCWDLFKEHFEDGELDFYKLYQVCGL